MLNSLAESNINFSIVPVTEKGAHVNVSVMATLSSLKIEYIYGT
jgi:hypothetical protein